MCAWRWPVSINVFVAASVCLPPAGSSFRTPSKLTEPERIQSEISLLEKIQEFHQNTVAVSQFVPGFGSQSVTEYKKQKSPLSSVLLKLSFNEKRLARPQMGFCWSPALIWSDALFVWMSHHPLSLKENPWSWPVPRLETLVQVFLDQCWCCKA